MRKHWSTWVGLALVALAVGLILPARARADEGITPGEVASFDRFLDQHQQIERDLRANPGLVDDRAYLQAHPELRDYLHDHPAVRQELRQHPQRFMNRERQWERHERRQRRRH
jgi:hypothetical protein